MKISDYLPTEDEKDTVLVQAQINKDLHKEVKNLMPKNIGWTELITAACKAYIAERKTVPKANDKTSKK